MQRVQGDEELLSHVTVGLLRRPGAGAVAAVLTASPLGASFVLTGIYSGLSTGRELCSTCGRCTCSHGDTVWLQVSLSTVGTTL